MPAAARPSPAGGVWQPNSRAWPPHARLEHREAAQCAPGSELRRSHGSWPVLGGAAGTRRAAPSGARLRPTGSDAAMLARSPHALQADCAGRTRTAVLVAPSKPAPLTSSRSASERAQERAERHCQAPGSACGGGRRRRRSGRPLCSASCTPAAADPAPAALRSSRLLPTPWAAAQPRGGPARIPTRLAAGALQPGIRRRHKRAPSGGGQGLTPTCQAAAAPRRSGRRRRTRARRRTARRCARSRRRRRA